MQRADNLLQPAASHAHVLASQAVSAASSLDVLTARDAAELAQAELARARTVKKLDNADKALALIGQKLDSLQPGEGNLDTLVRVVTALDPPQQAQQTAVAVQVVFRQEGR